MTDVRPIDAVNALRARGIDDAEDFLEGVSPEVILATCAWWDGQTNKKKGLLVWKLRQGGVEPQQPATGVQGRLREIYKQYADRIPLGSIAESHARVQARRGYTRSDGCKHDNPPGSEDCLHDDVCPGSLVIVGRSFPIWELECDTCGYLTGLTAKDLHLLPTRRGWAPTA